jgi:hypothetical protein
MSGLPQLGGPTNAAKPSGPAPRPTTFFTAPRVPAALWRRSAVLARLHQRTSNGNSARACSQSASRPSIAAGLVISGELRGSTVSK